MARDGTVRCPVHGAPYPANGQPEAGVLESPRATAASVSFGPFRLTVSERRLERDGVAVNIGGRAMDLLELLVARAGQVVIKKELMAAAWPGMVVEECNLRFHIAAVRKVLGQNGGAGRYLTTVAGRGYCFTCSVSASSSDPAEAQRGVVTGSNQPRTPGRTADARKMAADAAAELAQRRFLALVAQSADPTECDKAASAGPGALGNSRSEVPTAVAANQQSRRTDPGAGRPVDEVVELLSGKQVLVVFNGCEHCLGMTTRLAERLSRYLPSITILATGRTFPEAGEPNASHLHGNGDDLRRRARRPCRDIRREDQPPTRFSQGGRRER
jgi:DNA-binding winged helix-turn-helix (wHTH) protein